MINVRFVDEQDYSAIDDYIADEVWKRTHKAWAKLIKPKYIDRVLKGGNPNIHAVIVEETYLVLFSVIRPWFTDQTLLDEKLIFRLYDGVGEFSDVISVLETLAQHENAAGIMVGTGLAPSDKAMSRMYQRVGFESSSSNLYKETPVSDDIIGP